MRRQHHTPLLAWRTACDRNLDIPPARASRSRRGVRSSSVFRLLLMGTVALTARARRRATPRTGGCAVRALIRRGVLVLRLSCCSSARPPRRHFMCASARSRRADTYFFGASGRAVALGISSSSAGCWCSRAPHRARAAGLVTSSHGLTAGMVLVSISRRRRALATPHRRGLGRCVLRRLRRTAAFRPRPRARRRKLPAPRSTAPVIPLPGGGGGGGGVITAFLVLRRSGARAGDNRSRRQCGSRQLFLFAPTSSRLCTAASNVRAARRLARPQRVVPPRALLSVAAPSPGDHLLTFWRPALSG